MSTALATGASPRAYLFVPADRPERYAKARASGADAVIIDLEDAVAPAAKAGARDALANALDEAMPVVVRINAAGTPWFEADLELCRHPGVAGVMLPKADGIDAVCSWMVALVPLKIAASAKSPPVSPRKPVAVALAVWPIM